ncbi:hypothetical protein MRX96_006072 [Rhipicephalus microplus]
MNTSVGRAECTELVQSRVVVRSSQVGEPGPRAFNLYDLDNDGFVTRSEMLDIVTAIYVLHGKAGLADTDAAGVDIPRKRVDQLFAKLDTVSATDIFQYNQNKELIMANIAAVTAMKQTVDAYQAEKTNRIAYIEMTLQPIDADARISREEFCEGFKTDPLIRRALLNAVSMPDQPKSLRSFSTTSSE